MDEQQNNLPASPALQAASMPSLDAKGAARRRFARLGSGAAGVILTLHSQPGMAALNNAMCVAPSGFMSVTVGSRGPGDSCSYNRSHGYWKNHPEEWKTRAGIDSRARFGKIFPASGKYAALANATLMQVLDPTPEIKAIDDNNVAMQSVAALLNARAARYAGVPSVLPEESVMEIWKEYAATGYYTPSSGASIWSGAQTAEYLESTFR